jgi:trehalose 6-phosphate phosphatase
VKNILSDQQAGVLAQFLRQRVLLAFDFDGTLAPLVPEPSAAAVPPARRRLLAVVAGLRPCVVISGRARPDLVPRLAGIPLRAVLGNHGIEPVRYPRRIRRRVETWQALLMAGLPPIPGVVIEDKHVSLALHYRQARRHAEARRILVEAAQRLPDSRVMEGKLVVNVLPARTGDKGTALADLRRRWRCRAAIYVGDDDNDEDVFALATQGWLLGIRVGRSRLSQARYYLAGQPALDELLARMLRVGAERSR